MKSEEIIYQKVYVSRRPPPKISCKDHRMCEFDSDVAESSKDTQRIQLKRKTQIIKYGETRMWKEEIEERTELDSDTLNQEKHNEKSQTQQVRGDPHVDTNPQNVAC